MRGLRTSRQAIKAAEPERHQVVRRAVWVAGPVSDDVAALHREESRQRGDHRPSGEGGEAAGALALHLPAPWLTIS